MRSSIRRAAPSSQTKIKHESVNFVEDNNAPVSLIEVRSDGSSRKSQVTKSLVETYIQNDFQTHPNKQPSSSQQPDHETIKLFCSQRTGLYDGSLTPISLSLQMYTFIAPFARIPDVYPSILDQRALVNSFTQPQIPAHLSHTPLHDVRENF